QGQQRKNPHQGEIPQRVELLQRREAGAGSTGTFLLQSPLLNQVHDAGSEGEEKGGGSQHRDDDMEIKKCPLQILGDRDHFRREETGNEEKHENQRQEDRSQYIQAGAKVRYEIDDHGGAAQQRHHIPVVSQRQSAQFQTAPEQKA